MICVCRLLQRVVRPRLAPAASMRQLSQLSNHFEGLLRTVDLPPPSSSVLEPLSPSTPYSPAPAFLPASTPTQVPAAERPLLPIPTRTIIPVSDPEHAPSAPIQAHRLIRIKRKKLKNHQRRKRRRKRWHFFMMKQRRKKERTEAEFRARMNALMTEATEFDPQKYVSEILRR